MTGVPDDIQHEQRTPKKPVRLAIRLWGAADQCTVSQVPISIPWHRKYWNIQLKAHLKPHSIESFYTPAWPYQLLVCMYLRVYFNLNLQRDEQLKLFDKNSIYSIFSFNFGIWKVCCMLLIILIMTFIDIQLILFTSYQDSCYSHTPKMQCVAIL